MTRAWTIASWSAIGAGIAGLAGLLSTLPWPELFSIDAVPNSAIFSDPGLVLVGRLQRVIDDAGPQPSHTTWA